MTADEYQQYMTDVFYSLLLEGYNDISVGADNVSVSYLSKRSLEDPDRTNPLDILYAYTFDYEHFGPKTTNLYCATAVPAFYGLLKETETLLARYEIDTSKIAQKYDVQFAIPGKYVEDMLQILYRGEVDIAHRSVSGATYLPEEDLYIYNSLIDPTAQFTEKGWEKHCIWDESIGLLWNENACASMTTVVLWYDSEGNVYDALGRYMLALKDKSLRFDYILSPNDDNADPNTGLTYYLLNEENETLPHYMTLQTINSSLGDWITNKGTVNAQSSHDSISVGTRIYTCY